MSRAVRRAIMAAGILMMGVICIVYGFVETQIPSIAYLALWMICAKAVQYGAGGDSDETGTI